MMPVIWFLVSMFFVANHPVGEATYNVQHWNTEQECVAFLASPEGQKSQAALKAAIDKAAKGVRVEIKIACVPREDKSI